MKNKMVTKKINKDRKFYEKKDLIKQVVLGRLRQSKNVLTGSRAVNRHLPEYLQKKLVKDYDVLVRNGMTPLQAAKKMEAALDKKFGGNYFKVKQGTYPGVKKVVDINDDEVVDFVSMPKPKPKIKKSYDGVRYAGLKYLKSRFNAALKDTSQEFRHNKDKESLKRIKVYEKFHKPKTLPVDNWGITSSKNKKKRLIEGGDFKW